MVRLPHGLAGPGEAAGSGRGGRGIDEVVAIRSLLLGVHDPARSSRTKTLRYLYKPAGR
jgi:hypothetical protein